MRVRFERVAIIAGIALAAPAQAQIPIHGSGAVALSLPVGDLGEASNVGFDISARGETGITLPWGWRGDFNWDRFGGRGNVDNWTYYSVAGNILHRDAGGALYEFGGVGVYSERAALERPFVDVIQTDLGIQGGVGYNFSRMGGVNTFIEIGVTNVFTAGSNSAWFPLRFGIRF